MSRITVSRASAMALEVQPAPYQHAVRWRSQHDDGAARPWPNIFMTQDAYREVNHHAESEPDLEVGGMLVGQAYFTPEKEMYVIVEAQLEARHVQQSAAHLTFTSRTLADVLQRLDESHPGRQIVGWYHTHPGLTIFLSSMDVWLHSHFFSQAWQVALVVDPYVNHGGFFYYAGGATDYIHPRHYTGFYELIEPGQHSIVTWYNLTRDAEARVGRPTDQSVATREDVSE